MNYILKEVNFNNYCKKCINKNNMTTIFDRPWYKKNDFENDNIIESKYSSFIYNKEVMTTEARIITPPMVGVPLFFRCDLGPSSLSVCPTFNFLK